MYIKGSIIALLSPLSRESSMQTASCYWYGTKIPSDSFRNSKQVFYAAWEEILALKVFTSLLRKLGQTFLFVFFERGDEARRPINIGQEFDCSFSKFAHPRRILDPINRDRR